MYIYCHLPLVPDSPCHDEGGGGGGGVRVTKLSVWPLHMAIMAESGG